MLTDARIISHLHEIIRSSDLRTTTATAVCRLLEADLAVDLSRRKMFIVEEIDKFLHGRDDDALNEEQLGEVVRNDAVQEDLEQAWTEGEDDGEGEKEMENETGKKKIMRKKSSGTDSRGSKRKTRGPYNMKSLHRRLDYNDSAASSEGGCILQFDDEGTVIGPDKETRTAFSNYIGPMTRMEINDFITDWRHIDTGLKDTLWEDIKQKWRLPDFSVIKTTVLRKAGELRKNWKNKFSRREKAKGSSLSEDYQQIDHAGLAKWRDYTATPRFQEISEKAKQSQSHNLYPHHLGTSGYRGKIVDWAEEDPLDKLVNFPENLRPLLSSGNERTKNFLRARTRKEQDEKYVIDVDATQVLAQEVARLHEQQSKGEFVSVRHRDALSTAIGKSDHPGRVRGVGNYGTIRSVFGNPYDVSKGCNSRG